MCVLGGRGGGRGGDIITWINKGGAMGRPKNLSGFLWSKITIQIRTWKDNTPPLSCHMHITVKNWQNLAISNPKPYFYNINAHTTVGENPLIFTQVIVWKWKYGQTYWQPTWNHNTPPLSCGRVWKDDQIQNRFAIHNPFQDLILTYNYIIRQWLLSQKILS